MGKQFAELERLEQQGYASSPNPMQASGEQRPTQDTVTGIASHIEDAVRLSLKTEKRTGEKYPLFLGVAEEQLCSPIPTEMEVRDNMVMGKTW